MRWCAVVGCTNGTNLLEKIKKEGGTPPFKLYPFPTEKKNKELREKWIKAINRKDVKNGKNWTPNVNSRVCSKHFVGGKFDEANDVPSIDLGYSPILKGVKRIAPKDRAKSLSKRIKLDSNNNEVEKVAIWDHGSYHYTCDCRKGCDCRGCIVKQNQVLKLKHENLVLQHKVDSIPKDIKPIPLIHTFLENDEKVSRYTGLTSVEQFDDLVHHLSPMANKMRYWEGAIKHKEGTRSSRGPKRKLTTKEELLLVLMKLRKGLHNDMLSELFSVSEGTVSKIFNTWIKFLSRELNPLIYWPSRANVQANMPPSMQSYPNLRCTIDCTEVFIERPRDRLVQSLTWSDYKKHNTVKVLIGIAPNGTITYLSSVWEGQNLGSQNYD